MGTKKITLFANGCSHTAGSEMEYALQDHCYEKAWPKWLADDMGWDWVNIAQPGACNEFIRRTTIAWIAKNVETEHRYDPQDLVVMIMWSGFNRFEVWSAVDRRLKSYSGHADLSQELPELQQYARWRTIVEILPVAEYKSLMDMYITAKYLESLGIKYYFMNALHTFPKYEDFDTKGLVEEYQTVYKAYGGKRIKRHLAFHDPIERFWQWMQPVSNPPHVKWGHWGVDGHIIWKDYLKEWMKRIDDVDNS